MKISTATIEDVEKALESFKAAVEADSALEGLSGKKLAAAVDALTPKDNVTKDMKYAYGNAEKKWAMNVLNGQAEGCQQENKLEKIKEYVLESTAYKRLVKDEVTKDKVEKWLADNFPAD